MIKVEAIKDFHLKAFDELVNLTRYNSNKNEHGKIYEKDTFECNKEMLEYLTGNNMLKEIVVKIVEVKPEKIELPEFAKEVKIKAVKEVQEIKPIKNKKSKK